MLNSYLHVNLTNIIGERKNRFCGVVAIILDYDIVIKPVQTSVA